MRLSQCKIEIPEETVRKLKDYFPDKIFNSHFPANFEGKSDKYAYIVLVDRQSNHYSIAVRDDIDSIPVTLWEYDRALYHYEYNFGIDIDVTGIGEHIQKNIKREAEKAFTRIVSKRTRKEQKIQTQIETKKFNKFIYSIISSLKKYVTQEVISKLNNDENFKRFLVWQILSGIPHFNYKLPSANWMFTKSGMYDISSPDFPYIYEVSSKSNILAIETSEIRDLEEGRPFIYNNMIEKLRNEELNMYPSSRFFNKATEIRARVMQIVKRMNTNIFEALSICPVNVEGEIKII